MPNYWIIRTDVTNHTLWHDMPRVEIDKKDGTFLYRELWSVEAEDNPKRFIKMKKNDIALLTMGTSDQKLVIGEIHFTNSIKDVFRHETDDRHYVEVGYLYDGIVVEDFSQKISLSDFTFSLPRVKEPKSLQYILRRVISSSYKSEYEILKEKKVYLARSIFYETWFNLDDYYKKTWLLQSISEGIDLYSNNYQMLAINLLTFVQNEVGESLRMTDEIDHAWHYDDMRDSETPVYLEIKGQKEYLLEPHAYSETCRSLRKRNIYIDDIQVDISSEHEAGYVIDVEVMKSLLADGTIRENDSIFGGLIWTPIQLIA